MGKVPTLIHIPLGSGCEDYSFWIKHLRTLSMVLIPSSLTAGTPELEASFDEADTRPSSVFSGFLCSISTNSDMSKLHLPHSIKSQILMPG